MAVVNHGRHGPLAGEAKREATRRWRCRRANLTGPVRGCIFRCFPCVPWFPYVFAVEDGKAVVRRVKPGEEVGANVSIDSGLKAGEQIVVEGIQGIRPGVRVLASPIPPESRS